MFIIKLLFGKSDSENCEIFFIVIGVSILFFCINIDDEGLFVGVDEYLC